MRTLPLRIKRRGVFYALVKRSESAALYSLSYSDGGRNIGFDVFRLRKVGVSSFRGKIIAPYEQFPPDEAFGSTAWSFTTEKAALKKFMELTGGAHAKDL